MNSNKSAKKLFKLRKEGLKNKNYKKIQLINLITKLLIIQKIGEKIQNCKKILNISLW